MDKTGFPSSPHLRAPSIALLKVQNIVLDLILEHWSAVRAEIFRAMMEQLEFNVGADGLDRDQVLNQILSDLGELCERRKEITRVDDERADELRREIAEGHKNLMRILTSRFTF